jgi:hypothetical protein
VSICFHPYVRDQVRDIWIVPPAVRDDPDSFELSVSNANGADLLCTLGLAPEPGGGPVPIEHLAALVTEAARRHLDHRSPALSTVEDAQKGRLTVVLVGRTEGYIERRLSDLMADTTKPRLGSDTFRVGLTTTRGKIRRLTHGSRHAACTRSIRVRHPVSFSGYGELVVLLSVVQIIRAR